MARSAIALTTIVQTELMGWIEADKWDPTFDKKLAEAKSYGHNMLKDAYSWQGRYHNDALNACCSKTCVVASSGVFEDRMEVLGLFLAASDIVKKTTFLLEEYGSRRFEIQNNVRTLRRQKKGNIEQVKQATDRLNAIPAEVEGAREILTGLIHEWEHWKRKVDDIGMYELKRRYITDSVC